MSKRDTNSENEGELYMNRLKNSLIGVVVVCMWFVLSCSLYAEDLPQQVPEADQSGQRFITIDFDNVDIRLFIKYISELSGKNFVVDKAVQGNVTILSPTKISEDEAYKVFESVLEVHGFTTIVAGSVIKILPSARARSENVQLLKMGATDAPEDRVVTQLIRLKYSSPDDIKKVLAPLVSQTSVIISHAPSGMLIITETMSNIQKLLGIIEVLDVESREDEIAFIPVVNASADAIAKIITTVYQKNSGPQKAGSTRGSGDSIKVVPYDRVNALIVLASGSDLIRVKRLIAALDTEVQRAEGNFHVYYLQNATAVDLAAVLNDLPSAQAEDSTNKGKIAAISKDVRVMPDAETNSLIIRATKDEYLILENVIKQLDIPRRMVYLEALIMEVDVDKNFEVGVEWATTGTFSNGKFISGSSGSDGFFNLIDSGSSGGTPTLNNPGSGFTLGILKQGVNIGGLNFTNIGAVLKAFQSDSDVNVIATPQILTMDNKKADISVGEQVPFQTSNNTTDALQNFSQYEYKDVATKLSITPHINQSDVLRLEIETEVVRIKNLGLDGLTPTTFNRTATTTVILNDRSTVVIGGMIGHDGNESTYKVPFLGDIPLIGWLFRTESSNIRKTNMFIFITPRIVSNPAEIAAVTMVKEEEMGRVLPAIKKEIHKEVNIEHAMTLTRLGYEKLRVDEFNAAKEYFSEALIIDPVNPFALMNMGVVYEKEGKPKQAVEMYQAVVSSSSDAVVEGTGDPLNKEVPLKVLAQQNIDRILEH